MKEQDQVAALAELDGIELRPPTDGSKSFDIYVDGKYQQSMYLDQFRYKPYLTSYDALMPLIKRQSNHIKKKMAMWLWWEFGDAGPTNQLPAERMAMDMTFAWDIGIKKLREALLRATGKWIE